MSRVRTQCAATNGDEELHLCLLYLLVPSQQWISTSTLLVSVGSSWDYLMIYLIPVILDTCALHLPDLHVLRVLLHRQSLPVPGQVRGLVPGTRFNSYICTIPGTRVIGIPIWKIPVPVVQYGVYVCTTSDRYRYIRIHTSLPLPGTRYLVPGPGTEYTVPVLTWTTGQEYTEYLVYLVPGTGTL